MTSTQNARGQSARNNTTATNDAADHQALTDSMTGNPEAFTRLVERHASRCLTVARQVLIDEDMAQETVQDAHLDLWRHATRFDPVRSPLGPWLVMLTHRRAVDRVRTEQAPPAPPTPSRTFPATTTSKTKHTEHCWESRPASCC